MNVTARIESTGEPNRVHLSKEVADLLSQGGKKSWIIPRNDKVKAKGKGEMQTYWLSGSRGCSNATASNIGDESSGGDIDDILPLPTAVDKVARLVDWNVEKLVGILKQIVARREISETSVVRKDGDVAAVSTRGTPLEEVKEIISLPEFDTTVTGKQKSPVEVTLSATAVAQLRDYVTCIANMYRRNPFHNFEHASHVVQSVCKVSFHLFVSPLNLYSLC